MGCEGQSIQYVVLYYKVGYLPSIAGIKAMHAPENRPRRIANTIVPATSFTVIIVSKITPVPKAKAVPRLNTPILWAIAPGMIRPKKLAALRTES